MIQITKTSVIIIVMKTYIDDANMSPRMTMNKNSRIVNKCPKKLVKMYLGDEDGISR